MDAAASTTVDPRLLVAICTIPSHLLRAVRRLVLPFEKKFLCCSTNDWRSTKHLARRHRAALPNPKALRELLLGQIVPL